MSKSGGTCDRVRDQIKVGDITDSQGIAIGRRARATVRGSTASNTQTIDVEAVRAALTGVRHALGQTHLPPQAAIKAQAALGNALESGVRDGMVRGDIVTTSVRKVGEAFKEANVTVEQGTALGDKMVKLASVIGPLAGGAKIVAGWLGISPPV